MASVTFTSKLCTTNTVHMFESVRPAVPGSGRAFDRTSGPNTISIVDADTIVPIFGAKGLPRGPSMSLLPEAADI